MSGWIRIDRGLWDHPLFAKEPMSEREAWAWMIARAAWEDTKHRVGKAVVDVPRGSFMATLRELQSTFMWGSDTKVRNFLKRLECEGMIERTTAGTRNAPKTHVTVCNYDDYQSPERTKNAPKTHRERTKNAVNKQENNKQDISPNGSSVSEPDVFEDFWAVCPRKVGKGNARPAFRKALKKATASEIIEGMRKFARVNAGADPQFIAHPATWLNGERWGDDMKPRAVSQPYSQPQRKSHVQIMKERGQIA